MQLKSLCMDYSWCSDSCESAHVYACAAYTQICAHMRLSVHVSVTTVGRFVGATLTLPLA